MAMRECPHCGMDNVSPAPEPLHMLLAASMMVQRLRQYASTLQGCCTVCSHHANDITGILDSFATDSKGSNERESISRCPKCQRRMPDRKARFCIGSDCGYDTMDSKGSASSDKSNTKVGDTL